MTHLGSRMLEELQRRNYADSTIESYLRAVERFVRHFKTPPDQLGADQLRQYQLAPSVSATPDGTVAWLPRPWSATCPPCASST